MTAPTLESLQSIGGDGYAVNTSTATTTVSLAASGVLVEGDIVIATAYAFDLGTTGGTDFLDIDTAGWNDLGGQQTEQYGSVIPDRWVHSRCWWRKMTSADIGTSVQFTVGSAFYGAPSPFRAAKFDLFRLRGGDGADVELGTFAQENCPVGGPLTMPSVPVDADTLVVGFHFDAQGYWPTVGSGGNANGYTTLGKYHGSSGAGLSGAYKAFSASGSSAPMPTYGSSTTSEGATAITITAKTVPLDFGQRFAGVFRGRVFGPGAGVG